MKQLFWTLVAWSVSRLPQHVFTDSRFFELYQSRGWHGTPVHFYMPIPDTRELSTELWGELSELVGLDINMPRQLEVLDELSPFIDEFHSIPDSKPETPTQFTRSGGFRGIDGAILYSMIRKLNPRRVIEIGSGSSTLLSLLALRRNAEQNSTPLGSLTAIEPYPKDFLEDALADVGKLRREKVENVPLSQFRELTENDILFIDSSHTVKIGGDVVYEILDILPRLNKGVFVHIHDIFLPRQYPRDWIMNRHAFWTEQYLLQAFLAYNRSFEIVWSGGCMHAHEPDRLAETFPYYDRDKQQSGSIWIRRIA